VQPASTLQHHWLAQYSFAHLTSSEQLHPFEDVQRMTASLSYDLWPGEAQNFAATLLWGRNHSLETGHNFNGYLAEATLRVAPHSFWTRIENVDRTTELLLGKEAEPSDVEDEFLARVQVYTFGYDREVDLLNNVSTAIGGQLTFYNAPSFLKPIYGDHPRGVVLFVRVRPIGSRHQH
jgi:hypothetical protein